MPGFSVPEVDANPDGWGPTTVPEQLDGIPYAPFGKGDKIGRVSDFTNSGFNKYGGVVGVKIQPPKPPPLDVRNSIPKLVARAQAGAFSRTGNRASRCSISLLMMRCALCTALPAETAHSATGRTFATKSILVC